MQKREMDYYLRDAEEVEHFKIAFDPKIARFLIITNQREFAIEVPYGSSRFKTLYAELQLIVLSNKY